MLPQEIVEALSKLSSERLQMILNFAQASSINERITRRYNVVLEWNEPDEDEPVGGYTVFVPSLPSVITQGDTREEAFANAREAITCYLEYLLLTGQPLPPSDQEGDNLVEVTV
ncbi:type II toxin-antitoxin system HicB family antitoxin [Desulfofundulus thermocisternus]|jgi:predicted RNase H-like HicB family nuclease|uniref:type II toxin-antitoxin system HicB family antitoxin n=1 Tax=Desulfofundulus thermocisternus TaxID=42471 RepID=UPI00217E4A55|nr:type II toxin-antitoxin system HicB family antitoxin [Desulfofundulus thermocisternus]MCS5696652.1 type II toxin-antitoxin system HicB family antitoxin [Desulfofundulus thermocisternus]